MASLGGRQRRALGLGAAVAAALAIFAIQLLDTAVASHAGLFYILPVVIVAHRFGARAGALAGLLCFSIDLAGDGLQADEVGLGLHLARGAVLVLVGVLVGSLADRTRRALRDAETAARHFELAHDLACTVGIDGRLIQVSDSWTEELGWSRAELIGRPFVELVHPLDREATEAVTARVNAGNPLKSFVNRYRHKNGSWRHIEWASRTDLDSGLIFAAARDVTARIDAELARSEAEERFRRAFEDSPIGIALVGLRGDDANKLLEANEKLSVMLGYTQTELIGMGTLRDFTHPDDREMVAAGLERLAAGELTSFRCELRMVRRDGSNAWVELSTSVLHGHDGEPLYRLSQVHDIDLRRRTQEQLRRLADRDSLTDLFNRRRFRSDLERELDPSRPGQGAVLMIDVDGLKEINDRLGHSAGDSVLIGMADELRASVRSGDLAARLGGDEFAVLLRRVSGDEAQAIAEKLVAAMKSRLGDLRGPSAGLGGVSIGVAAFGADDGGTTSPEQLLETADRAMYEAKAAGGRRAVVA